MKLIVTSPNGKITTYITVGEYEIATGFKQRNIYHLATKYPNQIIKRGRFVGYTFHLVKPAS